MSEGACEEVSERMSESECMGEARRVGVNDKLNE